MVSLNGSDWLQSVAASFAFVMIVSAQAGAATQAGATTKAPVDFSGMYFPYAPEGYDFQPEPELLPEARKYYTELRAGMAKGVVLDDSTGRCIPPGLPRIYNRVYPQRVIQTPQDIVVLFEYESQIRTIYMDGTKHPEASDLLPTFNGHSIGHWEGNTLVVDTVGFTYEVAGSSIQINNGIKIGPRTHMTERWSLSDNKAMLTIQWTISDPDIFAKPWVTSKRFERREEMRLMEFECLSDLNPIEVGPDGSTRFKNVERDSDATR